MFNVNMFNINIKIISKIKSLFIKRKRNNKAFTAVGINSSLRPIPTLAENPQIISNLIEQYKSDRGYK